ncbi:MAG: FAD-binding oxidoreductase [Dehalococcoidia bacterium]|nr:FAD-binding oxidoreductase [Dehalococcoidia bacterium]
MTATDDHLMTTDARLAALRHAVPSDTERSPHAYSIDGVEPAVAFSPAHAQEIAALLRAADEAGLVVVPQGGRTALNLGRPLERHDVALDTHGLARIVEYVPDDLTLTVEAGIHLDALQQTLGEHGQYLPIDPPPDDGVSIGGLLATARSGAWRGHLPAARDLLLGAVVALPSGELAGSGGRVVKNVSGYDLHRLHTGALGAFGVIVQASFKVAPLPTATRTLAVRAQTLAEAGVLALRLWNAGLAVRALSVLAPEAAERAGLDGTPTVLVELAGLDVAVDRSAEIVREAARALSRSAEEPAGAPWERLRRLHGDRAATVVRLGVPATAVAEAVEAVRAAGCRSWGHIASGAVIGHAPHLDAAVVERLRAFAAERGGFVQVEAGSRALRAAADPFGPHEVDLVRLLKVRFDARGTLNRGRWMEGV